MDIGKPEKVTDEPVPIVVRPMPVRGPDKEPDFVPARRGTPWTTIPVKEPAKIFDDYLNSTELPSRCTKCGRQLEESGLLSFILSCPKHGVVLRGL